MKRIYSLVLMATALLIGTNVWAGNVAKIGDQEYETLEAAWAAVEDGQTITLIDNCTPTKTLWLGTETMEAANSKSITLDLNVYSIYFDFTGCSTASANVQQKGKPGFFITHGSLDVKGTGTIMLNKNGNGSPDYTNGDSHWVAFQVTGSTYKTESPKSGTPYTHLTIGAGVTIDAQEIGICVDRLIGVNSATHQYPIGASGDYAAVATAGVNMSDALSNKLSTVMYSGNPSGTAYGVRVDLYGKINAGKYGIKPNSELAGPSSVPVPEKYATKVVNFESNGDPIYYTAGTIAFDTIYSPFIHIHDRAEIKTVGNTGKAKNAGIYSGGYARFQVDAAHVEGSSGVVVKSGDVVLKGAEIASNYAGDYIAGTDTDMDRGFKAGGSGIVIISSDLTVGNTTLTVEGNTTITPTVGYALDENISTNAGASKVEDITIKGGTFGQGEQGTVKVTVTTAGEAGSSTNVVTITGGTFKCGEEDSDGVTIGEENLHQFLTNHTDDLHGVVIEKDDLGNETIVVSTGQAPAEGNSVKAATNGTSISWVNDVTKSETLDQDKTLVELQISQNYEQTLIIPNGKTLTADRIVLGAKAQIIVKAGGKLIVKGNQGIAAFKASNLILEASEDAQALFLLDPAVESNTHPMAKVQYNSNSFKNASGYDIQQFFGIPTYNGAVTNIETESDAKIYFDVWRNTYWDYIGAMNVTFTDSDPSVLANLDKFNAPFGLYCITSKNDAANKPVFTFSGELAGNMDYSFTMLRGWTTLANAYMGVINQAAIYEQLAAWNASYGTKQSIYTYDLNPATGTIQWHAHNAFLVNEIEVRPMQPMMFENGSKVEGLVLDYSALVWEPVYPSNPAPARRAINNITKAQINIAGENEADYTTIAADSELGDDRSFCAPKYNNPGLQLYVMGDVKYDIYATDEIENSYIGYRTVNAGTYTISFENVQGEDLVLIDLVNGARTNMTEGAIYTFHAEANESNDYRFQVVKAAKMPTAIDNVEAGADKKAGVYTLTGQYLGNASIFNALPAGVYVVDGEKKVK